MDANERLRNLHDIRTHLTVIKGYAQLARRELDRSDTRPKCRTYLETLDAQIERMRCKLVDWERTNIAETGTDFTEQGPSGGQ